MKKILVGFIGLILVAGIGLGFVMTNSKQVVTYTDSNTGKVYKYEVVEEKTITNKLVRIED